MANSINQVTLAKGAKANLGDIEKAAIAGVEQGNNTFTGNDLTINGINLTPNNIGTTLLGLNPTWIQNFGGATLAAGDHTTDVHMLDVLTPTNTLFNMSLALKKVASQGSAVTAAQAGQIFGGTGVAGSLQSMTGVTAVTTNIIPAAQSVITVSGTTAANLTLNDSATDLESDQDMAMILFNDYIIEANHVLTIGCHANNQHKASANEFIVSGAGTDVMDRQGATSDGHQDIVLTASAADTTILAGSYIYLNPGADTDELTIKGCFRTSGGTIAVTYAS
tara:strand:- start:2058 stop:2894 length:837 start_codon:yes stop_codon:yes gene_type:complete